MPKQKSPHGTARRYWSGCRCQECLAAHNDYCRAKHTERQSKRENPIVSAQAARLHLLMLKREFRVTIDAVVEATGIRRAPLMQIRNGRWKGIRRERERVILAVGAEARKFVGMVAATKTRELLAKISAAGLSQKKIGKRLGLRSKPRMARKPFVRVEKARAVEELYRHVRTTPKAAPKWAIVPTRAVAEVSIDVLREQVREAIRLGKDSEKEIAGHTQLSIARVETILTDMILRTRELATTVQDDNQRRYFFRDRAADSGDRIQNERAA